jgi:hypothetical protein
VSLVTHIYRNNFNDFSLFIMKLNEYQNMTYLKLQRVNLPATVTNKISHVAGRLAGDFLNVMKGEKFLVLNLSHKFVTDTGKNDMCSMRSFGRHFLYLYLR